jgi:perosamine synthetase
MTEERKPVRIPLAQPDITHAERRAVLDVLKTSTLAMGPQVRAFEEALASFAGVQHAIAANSGTSALHLAVRALGIGAGDEVITTPFSFVASSNCLLFERAKPVFVDIDPENLCLDPCRVEAAITGATKAILAVDVFGHPADWSELTRIARKRGLILIEDSAESLGSKLGERRCGAFGDAAVFAFYPNKQITTGEGGVVLTSNEELAKLCWSLVSQGRDESGAWLLHPRLGYNYRMDEMSAALGLAQLSRITEIMAARTRVASWYKEALQMVEGVEAPYVAAGVTMSWFVYVVRLDSQFSAVDRARVMKGLQDEGIGCRDYFQPIHLQPFYRELLKTKEGDFPVTESVAQRTFALPFFNRMTQNEVQTVVEALRELVTSVGKV